MAELIELLRKHGIQPTPQRVAVAEFILETDSHPTAEEVWAAVRQRCPTVSRATIYNALNLFVKKGLLKPQPLRGSAFVFDARVKPHHHVIDEETGRIYDIPWDAVKVVGGDALEGFEVREYQVVMRGRRLP